MQCKGVQEPSFLSFEEGGDFRSCPSPVPFQRKSNLLFPHQVGSVDSTCSSWPGSVWRHEEQQPQQQQNSPFSKYWLGSDFNNNNDNNNNNNSKANAYGRERVSVSSESSDSSTDEFFLLSDGEESYNTYRSSTSPPSSSSSSSPPSAVKTKPGAGPDQLPLAPCLQEDLNNNNDNNNYNTQVSNDNSNKNTTTTTISETQVSNNKNNNEKNKTKSSEKTKARLYDEDGYIRRAACVCLDQTQSKVLLVSSKDKCSWMVPGGGMEAGEEMSTAAIREAWEEAGVQGHITKYLGLFETNHKSGQKKHRTGVFVVAVEQVMEEYPEAYLGRTRQWFTLEEALLHLARTRPLQGAYLQLLLVSQLKVATA